ncbi:3'(2'),5'-bisphosphate nucleotidase CysQ [Oceanimonas baumannii]|uniref:3'(2'),5'-bisphosphate nucleotidase CysQ n=1 Tax=Oceanimonas baumannii TaxID=129578 RepID=A0A235CLQ6_9GAMM|nr:3'(2'),5'-bisphosphate nucleotidase CysQ [Oceanimonas baumannii]OYD25369.1 3'(2'),5'-bisphosphate nucleotidase [Oceanimonas baumannii]TDW61442.1 3'(2'), 5'-bisphosphate nucleotidase [Oceanimonas baumannii]
MSVTQELLNQVDTLARKAGAAIMEIYGREFTVEQKEDKSPLTEADAAAHHIIVQGLAELPLQAPILSEEDTAGFAGADEHGHYWLVDPLDGTKEFIKRNGEFTVNIALIENGKPVLGVVYAPALNVGYVAAHGLGAFKYEGNAEPVAIHVKAHQNGTPWRVVGSRSHGGGELPALLEQLGEHELVPMGSSLKLCLVAENAADIYPRLGPTSLWDTGAAQCVVEQAGGIVVQLNGEPLSYANTKEVLNPFFLVLGGENPFGEL